MVKRPEFLERLDDYLDDDARRSELLQMIRPMLVSLAESTRSAPDQFHSEAAIDQAATALADAYLQVIQEGMRAGAEWAGVRCGFAGTEHQSGIEAGIDATAAFLADAFHQGERRARETMRASAAMKAGEIGGRA